MVSQVGDLAHIDRLDIEVGGTYMIHFANGRSLIADCTKITDGGYWGNQTRAVPMGSVISGGGTDETKYYFTDKEAQYRTDKTYGKLWFARFVA